MTAKPDLYSEVTASIVRQLEAGVRPWAKPWAGGASPLPLRASGEAYRGVNVLMLWGAAIERGYTQRRWFTFKQALDLGANVRKGEKGSRVVKYGTVTREGEDPKTGEAAELNIPFLRAYTVFNAEQIDGLGGDYLDPPPAPRADTPGPIPHADAFFDALGVDTRHGGGLAFFSPVQDFVQLPTLESFNDAESYYATRAHECVHWTGHKSRLDRTFGRRFGDQAYAVEELVAELGAAFVAAQLGLYAEPREDHAAYLANWLRVLKADSRAIFTAASAAQKAADLLNERAASRMAQVAA